MGGLSARMGRPRGSRPKAHVRRSSRSGAERPIAPANRQASRTAARCAFSLTFSITQRDATVQRCLPGGQVVRNLYVRPGLHRITAHAGEFPPPPVFLDSVQYEISPCTLT